MQVPTKKFHFQCVYTEWDPPRGCSVFTIRRASEDVSSSWERHLRSALFPCSASCCCPSLPNCQETTPNSGRVDGGYRSSWKSWLSTRRRDPPFHGCYSQRQRLLSLCPVSPSTVCMLTNIPRTSVHGIFAAPMIRSILCAVPFWYFVI